MNTDKLRLFNFLKKNLNNNVQFSDEKQTKLNILQKITDKTIKQLITKYTDNFVCCTQCRSYNTNIIKDPSNNISILKCNSCGAERFVV